MKLSGLENVVVSPDLLQQSSEQQTPQNPLAESTPKATSRKIRYLLFLTYTTCYTMMSTSSCIYDKVRKLSY